MLFKECQLGPPLQKRTISVENEKTGPEDIPALVCMESNISCSISYFKVMN